jgi:hypothetical protein
MHVATHRTIINDHYWRITARPHALTLFQSKFSVGRCFTIANAKFILKVLTRMVTAR